MELLRIIAMLMILMIHSDFLALGAPEQTEFNNSPTGAFFRTFWELAGVIGVNLFVMISGFFGIRFSIKRTFSYLFHIFYWAIIVGIVLILLDNSLHFLDSDYSIKTVLTSPMKYWFVKEYLILMILSVPLNTFLDNTDKSTQQKFLMCYLGLACIGAIYIGLDLFSAGYSAISFVGIYVLGGYLKRNIDDFKHPSKYYIWIYFTLTFLLTSAYIVTKFLLPAPAALSGTIINLSMCYTGPINILSAALLIIAFAKMNFHSKIINYIAASAFGVYLFHCHPMILGQYISWCQDIYSDYSTIPYIGMLLLTYIGIFAFVVVVDQGRKWLMKAPVSSIIAKARTSAKA